MEQKRKKQREQINRRLNDPLFNSDPEPSDKKRVFSDNYMASTYAKIRTNNAHIKNDIIHETSAKYCSKDCRGVVRKRLLGIVI